METSCRWSSRAIIEQNLKATYMVRIGIPSLTGTNCQHNWQSLYKTHALHRIVRFQWTCGNDFVNKSCKCSINEFNLHMEHNKQNSGALLQSIIGNFKSIIDTSLMWVCVCVCVCACVRAHYHVYMCVYVCMCARSLSCVYVRASVHMHAHVYVCVWSRMTCC